MWHLLNRGERVRRRAAARGPAGAGRRGRCRGRTEGGAPGERRARRGARAARPTASLETCRAPTTARGRRRERPARRRAPGPGAGRARRRRRGAPGAPATRSAPWAHACDTTRTTAASSTVSGRCARLGQRAARARGRAPPSPSAPPSATTARPGEPDGGQGGSRGRSARPARVGELGPAAVRRRRRSGRQTGERQVPRSSCRGHVGSIAAWGRVAPWTPAPSERMADLVVEFGANVQPGPARARRRVDRPGGARPRGRRPLLPGRGGVRARRLQRPMGAAGPARRRRRRGAGLRAGLGRADDPRARRGARRDHRPVRARWRRDCSTAPTPTGSAATSRPAVARRSRTCARARLNWSAIPCPTPGWAALVHPDLDADAALARLWEQVVHICRVDEPDPVAAWGERMDQIEQAKAALNELELDAVHLRGPGTDLEIGLLPSSQWMGGHLTTQLRPRPPSQPARPRRCSRCPTRSACRARCASSKPLQLDGSIVRDFTVDFDGGRVEADRGGRQRRRPQGVRRPGTRGRAAWARSPSSTAAGGWDRSRRSSTTR